MAVLLVYMGKALEQAADTADTSPDEMRDVEASLALTVEIIRGVYDVVDVYRLRQIPNYAGWWRANETGEKVLYFASETLAEAAPGYDRSRVVTCLDNVGAIVERDAGHNTKRIRTGSFRPHVYAIDANAILSAIDT